MSDPSLRPDWGVVPQPIRLVLQRLKTKAANAVDSMDTAHIAGSAPQNHDEAFLTMAAAAERADRATRDYRSVFNAYVHKFHQPKPPIGELAAMQGTITQSFAKRYTPKTVGAIEALLAPVPDLDAIRLGIRALGFNDLRGLSAELDAVLTQASDDPKFVPWSAVGDTSSARVLRSSTPGGLADDFQIDLGGKPASARRS